jgi:U3 small nucleolar RNA-associated protein 15
VEKTKQVQLKKYDRLLKKFQYSNALDSVLGKNRCPPDTVVCLIKELVHMDALRVALSNRDDIRLEPIARFLAKNISHPRYTSILVDVTNLLLGMCSIG